MRLSDEELDKLFMPYKETTLNKIKDQENNIYLTTTLKKKTNKHKLIKLKLIKSNATSIN